jgi:hypothetical protein
MDGTAIPPNGTAPVGIGSAVDNSLGAGFDVYVGAQQATTGSVGVYAKPSNGPEGYVRFPSQISATVPVTFATTDYINLQFEVPIANYLANITTVDRAVTVFGSNSNATNTASDTTSFVYGTEGALIPNGAVGTNYIRRVQFPSANQVTDKFFIETNSGSGWNDISTLKGGVVIQGTNVYGAGINSIGADFVNVIFYTGGVWPSNATYAGNGAAWSTLAAEKWRVRRVSEGGLVGVDGINSLLGGTQLALPAAATVVALNNRSPRTIVINSPASPQNQDLPSAGVLAGSRYTLIVSSATVTNYIALRSSNGTEIDRISGTGLMEVVAVVNGPTTAADWNVVNLRDIVTVNITATGPVNLNFDIQFRRHNKNVWSYFPATVSATATSTTFFTMTGVIPTYLRPAVEQFGLCTTALNNGAIVGNVMIRWYNTGGNMYLYATNNFGNFTSGGSCGVQRGATTNTYTIE